MTNIMVRTSIATLTALTVSAGTFALSSAPAAAAPMQAENYMQLVGGKKQGHRGHRALHGHQRLHPHQIVRILERRGFRNVRRVYLSHGKYFAKARGRHGPVRLVVHAKSGQILSRQRLHRPHRHGWNPYYYNNHQRNGFSWSFTYGK